MKDMDFADVQSPRRACRENFSPASAVNWDRSQQRSCHQAVLGKVLQRTFRASRAPGFAMEALAAHNSVVTSCNLQLPTDTRAGTASARIGLRQQHRRQRLSAVRLRCSWHFFKCILAHLLSRNSESEFFPYHLCNGNIQSSSHSPHYLRDVVCRNVSVLNFVEICHQAFSQISLLFLVVSPSIPSACLQIRDRSSHRRHIVSSVPAVQSQQSKTSKQKSSSLPALPPSSLSAILNYSNRLLPSDGIPLYVGASRLLQKTGLTIEEVQRDVASWAALGAELARQLGFTASEVTESQLRRVFQYYLPVFSWAWKQLQEHRESGNAGPLVVSEMNADGKQHSVKILISCIEYCDLFSVAKVTATRHKHASLYHCGSASLRVSGSFLASSVQAGTKVA